MPYVAAWTSADYFMCRLVTAGLAQRLSQLRSILSRSSARETLELVRRTQ